MGMGTEGGTWASVPGCEDGMLMGKHVDGWPLKSTFLISVGVGHKEWCVKVLNRRAESVMYTIHGWER